MSDAQISGTEGRDDARLVAAGIGLTLLGVLLFSINDAIGKWTLSSLSLSQLLILRSVTGLVLMSPIIIRSGAKALRATPQPRLQIGRTILSSFETAAFFLAVTFLPLADVVTFYLASPIFVTILAMILLGEKVGWRRWAAILVGFAGVVVALGPSASVATWPALIALAGSLMFSLLVVLTRHLRATPDLVLVTSQFVGVLALGFILAPFGWVALTVTNVTPVIIMGVLAVGAHFTINRSLKLAPASTVAPFHYTLIIWAVVFGYVIFGDVPSLATIIGALMIVGAGLFIFFRERELGKKPTPLPEV